MRPWMLRQHLQHVDEERLLGPPLQEKPRNGSTPMCTSQQEPAKQPAKVKMAFSQPAVQLQRLAGPASAGPMTRERTEGTGESGAGRRRLRPFTSCSGRTQEVMPTAWKTHSVQKMCLLIENTSNFIHLLALFSDGGIIFQRYVLLKLIQRAASKEAYPQESPTGIHMGACKCTDSRCQRRARYDWLEADSSSGNA